jgi:alpha-glucosidase
MLDVAATLRRLRFPCDVLYFDLYYHDNLQILSWDPVKFANPIEMNRTLGEAGFRRVNIVDPVVLPSDRVYDYLNASGYFLKDASGNTIVNEIFYGHVSWIDFTKPSLRNWYKEVFKIFLATGVDGVWNDLNEPAQNFMPEAIYDFGGERRTDMQARNLYALQTTSLTYETMKELRPNVRPWIFSRSGFSGIQRYSANWGGDANTSFDSLRVSVQMSASMGLSGQNQFGHDIGGFLGAPSPELFIRWMQFGSLIPIFRNHATDTTPPREPWVFGEPYSTMAREIINRRYRLLPYLYTVTEEASRSARPTLAPLVFHFPQDELTYNRDDEFMLGDSLLVAPVVVDGARTRTLYLPAGTAWYDFYDPAAGALAGGQEITVSAPLDRIPIFVRAGAIIPQGPVRQYVNEPVEERMTIDIYPGGAPQSSFTLYEDDGVSFDYARGTFLRTELRRDNSAGKTTFSISRREGTWKPPARPWWLSFRGVETTPSSVKLNGVGLQSVATEAALESVIQGYFYDSFSHRLVVRAADSIEPLVFVVG